MGSIAVILLNELGYKVTAVTGKSDKNVQEMLKNLGASNIVARSNFEGNPKPLSKEIYAGAVDTVGGVALTNVLTMVSLGNRGILDFSTRGMRNRPFLSEIPPKFLNLKFPI